MRSSAARSRRFGYAIAISLVVHAVALFGGLPVLRESLEEPVPPPPLVTRLVELPKALAEPAPAPPPREEKKAVPRPPAKKPQPPRAEPLPAPAPPAAEAPPAPAEPAPVASAPPVVPAAPAAPPSQAVEAATAAQYRLQLIAYAQRHKPPYPSIARENNWTGDVVLEITIRADGRAELSMRRGSGHAVLDQLALDTYQQALAAVPVPASLQGKQVRLQPLRVIYNLTGN